MSASRMKLQQCSGISLNEPFWKIMWEVYDLAVPSLEGHPKGRPGTRHPLSLGKRIQYLFLVF